MTMVLSQHREATAFGITGRGRETLDHFLLQHEVHVRHGLAGRQQVEISGVEIL